jgi:ribonuclease Z
MKLILDDKRVQVFSFPLKHRVKTYGFLFREKEKDGKIIKEKIAGRGITIAEMAQLKSGADIVRDGGEVISNAEMTTLPAPGVSYAFCSDTAYFPRLSTYVAGVSMLYHEATFGDDHESLARQTGHSTARHAATVAREAGAGRLLLGHFSARYKSPVQLEEEARQIFPGAEAAREGETYDI